MARPPGSVACGGCRERSSWEGSLGTAWERLECHSKEFGLYPTGKSGLGGVCFKRDGMTRIALRTVMAAEWKMDQRQGADQLGQERNDKGLS